MNIDLMQSLMYSYFRINEYENVKKIFSESQKQIFEKGFENQYIHIEVDFLMLMSDIIKDPLQASQLQEKVSMMNERYEKKVKSRTMVGLIIEERKVMVDNKMKIHSKRQLNLLRKLFNILKEMIQTNS